MLNTDWTAKKQLDASSINHFYKQQIIFLKEIRILDLNNLNDLTLNHVFQY